MHWFQNSTNFYSTREQLLQFLFVAPSEPRLRHKSMETALTTMRVTARIVFIITHHPYPTPGESHMRQILVLYVNAICLALHCNLQGMPRHVYCLEELKISHLTKESLTHTASVFSSSVSGAPQYSCLIPRAFVQQLKRPHTQVTLWHLCSGINNKVSGILLWPSLQNFFLRMGSRTSSPSSNNLCVVSAPSTSCVSKHLPFCELIM